ncbi:MAG: LacI family transcriptional regulator [Erysipelothrix sp.]|nr:LacI family transcriptional regulator [Erysipelothrix sp.]
MKKEKLTINDIAQMAGVSTATVSRVLSGKDKVKEETKQHVLDIVKKSGYDSSKLTALSNDESKTILVCMTELKNPFNVPVFDGIQNSARKHGYDVLILQTKDFYTEYHEYESVLKSQSFAGVIFVSTLTQKQLTDITTKLNYRTPIVLCSEYIDDPEISYVGIDDISAITRATNYLLSLNRKNIFFINSKLTHNYARKREQGFREALESANVEVNEDYIVRMSSVNHSLAYASTLSILNQDDKPDAILCASDVFAIGALKACQRKGLRVPEDIAIIGFDNIELTTMVEPSLTTIEQPSYKIGYQSCELLVEKIVNPRALDKHILLETELILRDSTPINIKGE